MKKHLQTILSLLCVLALVFGTFTALAEGNVSKVITVKWSDRDNYDQLRPAQIKAILAGQEVVLNEANGWTGEVSVPAGTDPGEWSYDAVDGYTAILDPGDISELSLTHAVAPLIPVTGKVVKWEDSDNVGKIRPDAVTLILLADGATYGEPKTVKAPAWTCTWEDLPQFAPNSDTRIVYSVKPLQVPEGYTCTVSENGLEVTFTLRTAELSVKAEVSGYPEGTDLSALVLTVDGPDPSMPKRLTWADISGGSYSFGKVLPGAYLVRGTNADTLVEGYTMDAANTQVADAVYVNAGESKTLTYKYTYKLPEAIEDVDTEYDPWANIGSLSIEILGPDDRMPIKVTYAEFTDGKYELENLKPGTYTVVERNAEGLVKYYTLTGASETALKMEVSPDGTTCKLFNQYTPAPTPEPDAEFVDIPVTKTWNDSADKDGNRPESVTVRLYADGVEVDSHVLTAAENWSFTFVEKPRYQEDNKTEIVYTVNEDDVPMYTKEINGFNLVNSYLPEVTSQTVAKVWQDNDNKQNLRPVSIAMTLSDGKKVVATVILSKENNWTATVENLPTVVDGEKVTYSWTEQSVLSYTLTNVEVKAGVTTFTNKLWERPEEPTEGKKPKTPGEAVTTIEEYDTPLGVEVIINHVGDCFD